MSQDLQGPLRRHCVGAGSAATFTPALSRGERALWALPGGVLVLYANALLDHGIGIPPVVFVDKISE